MAWVSPETVKQIGIEAIKQERQVGDILIEAINEWFAKRGLQRFD